MGAPSPRRVRMTGRLFASALRMRAALHVMIAAVRSIAPKAEVPASSPGIAGSWGGVPAGWPRRPHQSIPLLPSGPGGIFDLASRGTDGATIRRGPLAWPCDLRHGCLCANHETGGERGIRTPEARFRRLHTFQACSFNHSDTSPCLPDRGRTGPQILAVAGPYHKLNLPAAVAETGRGTISAQTEPVARCLISFSPASGARSVLPNS